MGKSSKRSSKLSKNLENPQLRKQILKVDRAGQLMLEEHPEVLVRRGCIGVGGVKMGYVSSVSDKYIILEVRFKVTQVWGILEEAKTVK